jgi:hypothetical protein
MLRMVLWNNAIIKNIKFTHLLELPTKFHTLISEYFGWNPKSIEHFVQNCISSTFSITIWQWHQFQPLEEMPNHNQDIDYVAVSNWMDWWNELLNLHSSIYHTCKKELPSHLNCLTLCTTWSCSLGVNIIGILATCKYAIISVSSCMSKILLFFN